VAATALGATPDPDGTTFEVWSSVADRIELCLFADDGTEADRVDLEPDDGRWRVRVGGAAPGQRYGYRAHGPGDPANGLACDPAKLLVDPAARRVEGEVRWHPDLLAPGVDSAPHVPRSVVVAAPEAGAVGRLAAPRPWDEQLVYEAHVGHLTARHPMVGAEHRGRYAGLSAPPVIDHLLRLGVTAVELLPVQQFVSEPELVATGRRNVWGYNPLAWGAPHAGYATAEGDPVAELRAAVADLHEAGLEVWLDVVFNHTCEGALGSGPILSWRGFDNPAAYRLIPGEHGVVDDDVTGCGNAIDARSPWIRRLLRESLVRWVEEFGIDGFRFDLAATLIRGDDGPTAEHALLAELAAEPALAEVRFVAEPWDTGLGGYAPGRFPAPWREWNDRFRDDVRGTWRAEPGGWSTFADRLTGSADRYRSDDAAGEGTGSDRGATVGVNAVATHDGLTLADQVTWARPVGGGHDQRSSNGGIEGPTSDPAVADVRRRRQRAMVLTLLCAQGIPLLHSGDELGATQGGVADGYTLEPAAWGLAWEEADWDLVAWVAAAAHLRHRHGVLRRARWVEPDHDAVRWLTVDGTECTDDDGHHGRTPGIQVLLAPDDPAQATALLLVGPRGTTSFQLPEGTWWRHLDAGARRPSAAAARVEGPTIEVAAPGALLLLDQP
jgi:glycogen operon protein